MPGFTGPKLKWIARHEPDNRRRTERRPVAEGLFAPQARRRTCLTDMSDAAGTWLLDEAARAWSAEAFAGLRGRSRLGAAARRGVGPGRPDRAQGRRRARPAARRSFGRRRRRRGCRSDRPRRDRAGRGVHFPRHRDPAHRRDRPLPERARKARPFFRPCAAGSLVRDGGDAQRRWRASFRRPASRRAARHARARSSGGLSGPGQRFCSCPIFPASARRSTTLMRAASCSA